MKKKPKLPLISVNSQQSTANSQQSTVNSQQPTANSQQPTANTQLSFVSINPDRTSVKRYYSCSRS
ncbi:MAG: hypothetical protein WBA89_03275 [Microcoleus sp.]|uniref:hypothetical protein n=1 Tax=Microcoleus sp. TaxID=44472 RepID=UPI003C7359D8